MDYALAVKCVEVSEDLIRNQLSSILVLDPVGAMSERRGERVGRSRKCKQDMF